jgi:hypothetical protein
MEKAMSDDVEYMRFEWADIWPWLVVILLVLGLGTLQLVLLP